MRRIGFDIDGVIMWLFFFFLTGAKAILGKLHDEGFEIYAVTARYERWIGVTKWWFRVNGLGFVIVIPMGESKHLQVEDFLLFVDNKEEHLWRMQDEELTIACLFDPKGREHNDFKVLSTWWGIYQYVHQIAARAEEIATG
ncbi:MAG: hypothetical protein PHN39_01695 [Candidatus Pacebacteria bacterium]|nr:hypothetical protein [Candidatus Paceibacterota bacterium]